MKLLLSLIEVALARTWLVLRVKSILIVGLLLRLGGSNCCVLGHTVWSHHYRFTVHDGLIVILLASALSRLLIVIAIVGMNYWFIHGQCWVNHLGLDLGLVLALPHAKLVGMADL